MDKEKQIRLTDEDWDLLLPGKTVTLGETELFVEPLGLKILSKMMKKIKAIYFELKKAEITKDNYKEIDNIFVIAELISDKAPEIISESCNLHIDDVNRLTPIKSLPIVEAILSINIESQRGLLKNFGTLANQISELVGENLE